MEEEKVDNISDEDMHYDRGDNDFLRRSIWSFVPGVGLLQPRSEGKSYKSVIKSYNF